MDRNTRENLLLIAESFRENSQRLLFLLWTYFQEECGEFEEVGSHQNAGGKDSERTIYHKMVTKLIN